MTATTIAYNKADAASAVGVSIDVINRAIRAGDLVPAKPTINGKTVGKVVILASELERWVRGAAA